MTHMHRGTIVRNRRRRLLVPLAAIHSQLRIRLSRQVYPHTNYTRMIAIIIRPQNLPARRKDRGLIYL